MKVTFVSYDGEYPNLCRGELILAVDGVPWQFPECCLSSGGCTYFDEKWNGYVEEGPRGIRKWPVGFPAELKEEATRVVNANVPYGCCGGCL